MKRNSTRQPNRLPEEKHQKTTTLQVDNFFFTLQRSSIIQLSFPQFESFYVKFCITSIKDDKYFTNSADYPDYFCLFAEGRFDQIPLSLFRMALRTVKTVDAISTHRLLLRYDMHRLFSEWQRPFTKGKCVGEWCSHFSSVSHRARKHGKAISNFFIKQLWYNRQQSFIHLFTLRDQFPNSPKNRQNGLITSPKKSSKNIPKSARAYNRNLWMN
jgi:hypothetical protein